jgi:hypothetical protein
MMQYRTAEKKDVLDIVRIVGSVYGRNYSDRSMYNPEHVRELIADDATVIFLALWEETPIGMLIFTKDRNFPGTGLLGGLMTVPEERYHGAAIGLLQKFFAETDLSGLRSIWLLAITTHTVSQRIAAFFHFRCCGVLMNAYLNEAGGLQMGRPRREKKKRSNLIAVKNLTVTDAGNLYVPPSLKKAVSAVYDSLGVKYRIVTKAGKGIRYTGKTEAVIIPEPGRFNTKVVIRRTGPDGYDLLKKITDKPDNAELQTFQIFAAVNEPESIEFTGRLLENGYLFCGMKPLGDREYAVFYFSEQEPGDFENRNVLDEYSSVYHVIEKCSEARK